MEENWRIRGSARLMTSPDFIVTSLLVALSSPDYLANKSYVAILPVKLL
jgi:hypothetical protein